MLYQSNKNTAKNYTALVPELLSHPDQKDFGLFLLLMESCMSKLPWCCLLKAAISNLQNQTDQFYIAVCRSFTLQRQSPGNSISSGTDIFKSKFCSWFPSFPTSPRYANFCPRLSIHNISTVCIIADKLC